MINLLIILGMNLSGQISLIAHEVKDDMFKNEESRLELLGVGDYHLAKPFFTDFKINQPILHAMLENKSDGKVFTDNKINPSFMLACSPPGYVFLGGLPDQASLFKIGSYL